MFKKRRLIPVAIAMVAVIAVSGVAFAYWTATGSGTGSATMATPATVTVTQVNTLSAMFPGDSAQTTQVTLHNPSTSQPVHVTNVSISDVTTDKTGCTVADFLPGVAVTPWGAGGTTIAALGTTATVNGPTIQFFNDPANNQDACKGAAVTVHYSVS